jgi:small-conductance mechanosensitive channel
MLERMVSLYGRRNNRPLAAAGLSRTLIYVLVLGTGLVILLRSLGLTVTPLLTALGVGGLAVALALQDTLANFFAGIHIIVESPVSVGDFIRLSSSEEGIVTDIGWRTTRVTNMQNNVIVIPNSKITASILLNFSLPEARLATDVDVVVGHEADLDAVRDMLLEEAAQAEHVLADPPPMVLMDPGVTPTHVQMKLWVQIPERTIQGLVRSDLRFRIARRLKRENVPMPRMDYVVTGPPVGA